MAIFFSCVSTRSRPTNLKKTLLTFGGKRYRFGDLVDRLLPILYLIFVVLNGQN